MANQRHRLPSVLFFDLVGTLIRPTESIGRQYARCAARFGVDGDPDRLEAAFGAAIAAAPPMLFADRPAGDVASLERAWWIRLVREVVAASGLAKALSGSAFEAYFDALYDHFATAGAWALFPDVLPAFERLKAKGVRLGLVTNYDSRVFVVIEALGLAPFFDTVAIPALAGAAKPDPRIFRWALGEMGADAADVVHVGDELADDVRGAEGAGLRAVLVDRIGGSAPAGVARIEKLTEILSLPG
jgi:putative hydrolase of the HAD superfamily